MKCALILVLFMSCINIGGRFRNDEEQYYRDVQFIQEDSLVADYCLENYSYLGYNCDSIIRINKLSDYYSNDNFNRKHKNRCYTVSFFLEEDYIHANVLLYEFKGDSVYFYESARKDIEECDFHFINARRRTESTEK